MSPLASLLRDGPKAASLLRSSAKAASLLSSSRKSASLLSSSRKSASLLSSSPKSASLLSSSPKSASLLRDGTEPGCASRVLGEPTTTADWRRRLHAEATTASTERRRLPEASSATERGSGAETAASECGRLSEPGALCRRETRALRLPLLLEGAETTPALRKRLLGATHHARLDHVAARRARRRRECQRATLGRASPERVRRRLRRVHLAAQPHVAETARRSTGRTERRATSSSHCGSSERAACTSGCRRRRCSGRLADPERSARRLLRRSRSERESRRDWRRSRRRKAGPGCGRCKTCSCRLRRGGPKG